MAQVTDLAPTSSTREFALDMKENLRQRRAAAPSVIVNIVCAIVVLLFGRNFMAILLAIFLLGWAAASARRWINLRRSQE
jgi:hypothetical protein